MRLRNIPRANQFIAESPLSIKHPENIKGKWDTIFNNQNPIDIEIGMGKGQFLLNMAMKYPHVNFIGIERYASVLIRALERAAWDEYKQLKNVRFICMDARSLGEVFAKEEVSRIFLNFSDPWPKSRHIGRRLSSRIFLNIYAEILSHNGSLEMKTDNTELFDFSLGELKDRHWVIQESTYDLHQNDKLRPGNIMTEYEEKFSRMGQPINKLIALPPNSKI